ncbi:MAG: substrate-binding domain-containing protein [Nocardioidaceae bacterium]
MPSRTRPSPTLDTVAAEAGVSRQTVSNALNSPHLLRADTLARVQAAIDRLGYMPNRAARNLRTKASRLIGLRVEPPTEGRTGRLTDRFLYALANSARTAELQVLLFSAEDPADPHGGYEQLLGSRAVDAFVLADANKGNPLAPWLTSRQVPFVAFGRPWAQPEATHPWVDIDGQAGVALAVDHVVDRGHERVAWVGRHKDSFIGEDRRSGWVQRMHERGLSTSQLSARGDDTIDYGRRATFALLDGSAPTAFLCASDTIAVGVLQALRDRGLTVGGDPEKEYAVVGFDDSLSAQVTGLTTVRPPLEEVAGELVRLLDLRLTRPMTQQPGVILRPSLRVRTTS